MQEGADKVDVGGLTNMNPKHLVAGVLSELTCPHHERVTTDSMQHRSIRARRHQCSVYLLAFLGGFDRDSA